jgi:hypothetical protein
VIGRRNSTLGLVVALIFLLAGLGLFLMSSRKVAEQEKSSSADR